MGRDMTAESPKAEQVLDSKLKGARRQPRKCLSCPRMIMSEGPHHRMCNTCRAKGADDADAPYRIGS